MEDALHPYLRERLRERTTLAVGDPVETIRAAVMAAETDLERRREAGLIDELRGRLGRDDRATAGRPRPRAPWPGRRVERLLVSGGYHEEGWSCAGCGTLAKVGPTCPRCGTAMREEQDVVAAAIDDALAASCRVDVCDRSADLDVLGRIGALLRF